MIVNAIPKNTVLTIWSEDTEEEYKGILLAANKEEVVIANIDDRGENDGFLYLKQEGIYRIDYGTVYEKRIERLYQAKQQAHEDVRLSEADGTLLEQLLEWAYRNRKIVTVYYEDDIHEFSGYLQDPEGSRMKQVDIYDCDYEEGYSDIDISKAIAFCVDSSRAQDAEIVFRIKEQESRDR